jgi:hypothetical protein
MRESPFCIGRLSVIDRGYVRQLASALSILRFASGHQASLSNETARNECTERIGRSGHLGRMLTDQARSSHFRMASYPRVSPIRKLRRPRSHRCVPGQRLRGVALARGEVLSRSQSASLDSAGTSAWRGRIVLKHLANLASEEFERAPRHSVVIEVAGDPGPARRSESLGRDRPKTITS